MATPAVGISVRAASRREAVASLRASASARVGIAEFFGLLKVIKRIAIRVFIHLIS
ncbi:hypothetical protein [Nostoc sp. ChiVER01]|uniref:hypothetical protein n=1 Tax=Nostoc sp. ChiVER01 TaxID=3075382 RepID=UPI002AD3A91A|nr:hypothetical protein [Nostoc sp. ChiVER01]MDZ8227941.1 hypothetical protein [Nostoc sp. ChiVER01]